MSTDDCYMAAEAVLQLLRKSPALRSVTIVMGEWVCVGSQIEGDTGARYTLSIKKALKLRAAS